MSRNADHERDAEASIAVPIPASNPRLFGNKAVDDLLAFLARNRNEQFGVRELAENIGHSRSTVSRAVDVLSDNGLVEEERGTRRLVTLDAERLAVPEAPVDEVPQPSFRPPLRAAVDALTTLEGVVAIIVYGPIARGTADSEDDVRLRILLDGEVTRRQKRLEELRRDLEERAFGGTRYEFTLEAQAATATEEEGLRDVLLDGIVLHRTEAFETISRRIGSDAPE